MPSYNFSDTKSIVEKIEELSGQDLITNLQNYLHQTGRKEGGETVFECPFCNDKSKNNLLANNYKKVAFCFASNGDHSKEILSEIYSNLLKDKPNYKNPMPKRKKIVAPAEEFFKSTSDIKLSENPEINTLLREKLVDYTDTCNTELLNDAKSLKYLYNKRGITKETVASVGIGIDRKRRKWTLPKYTYQTTKNDVINDTPIINCELRGVNFDIKEIQVLTKKDFLEDTQRTPDGENASLPTALCQINCYIEGLTDTLFITEGFFDGYIALQTFKENNFNHFHIVTSSNGIGTLEKQIGVIDFDKYKQIILCVDNDETSEPIAEKVLNELSKYHPNITKQEISCKNCKLSDFCKDDAKKKCKDLNDRYLMKLKHNQTAQEVI